MTDILIPITIISGSLFWMLSVYLAYRSGYKDGRLAGLAEGDRARVERNKADVSFIWRGAKKPAPMDKNNFTKTTL